MSSDKNLVQKIEINASLNLTDVSLVLHVFKVPAGSPIKYQDLPLNEYSKSVMRKWNWWMHQEAFHQHFLIVMIFHNLLSRPLQVI